MTGYVCKYAPVEVLAGFSVEAKMVQPYSGTIDESGGYMEAYLCPYSKAVLAAVLEGAYNEIIITDCCEGFKNLADAIERKTNIKVFRLSLPSGDDAPALYATEIKRFIQSYVVAHNLGFDMEKFVEKLKVAERKPGYPHVALMGASTPEWFAAAFSKMSELPLINYSCVQPKRYFDNVDGRGSVAVLDWYAEQLVNELPSPLLSREDMRAKLIGGRDIVGIVYNEPSGCGIYNSEYIDMVDEVPLLRMDMGFGEPFGRPAISKLHSFLKDNGWLMPWPEKPAAAARAESGVKRAPSEGAKSAPVPAKPAEAPAKPVPAPKPAPPRQKPAVEMEGDFYVGIDSGRVATKVLILDSGKKIVASGAVITGSKTRQGALMAMGALLTQKKISRKSVRQIVATGHGRNAITDAGKDINEIDCHAKGALFLFPGASTIIDIGGQDCKVIEVDHDGNVVDFSMNDKCAAGTGMFLDMMAKKLGIGIDAFSVHADDYGKDLIISGNCAVFAGAEVDSFLAEGQSKRDIIHAVNGSIANRITGIIASYGCMPAFVLTGGVAKDKGLVEELSLRVGEPMFVPDDPSMAGALGAALFALEDFS